MNNNRGPTNCLSLIGSESGSYSHLYLDFTGISRLYDAINDVVRGNGWDSSLSSIFNVSPIAFQAK